MQLRQEAQSWESALAGCNWEFNCEVLSHLVGAYTEPYVLHSQLYAGVAAEGRVLGTFSLTDFQDFLLLCGPFSFSQRNDENRQSDKPWGSGPSKALQLYSLLQAAGPTPPPPPPATCRPLAVSFPSWFFPKCILVGTEMERRAEMSQSFLPHQINGISSVGPQ